MPLIFDQIYRVTNIEGGFLGVPLIAMGVRKRHDHDASNTWRECYQFLVPKDVQGGHQIFGETLRDEGDGVVALRDLEKEGPNGERVVWLFEPLTVDMFHEMGSQGHISRYDSMKDMFATTADLHQFYTLQYLDDWWQENE
jgi:hypothetical protein